MKFKRSIYSLLRQMSSGSQEVKVAVPFALAKAIAYQLPLPTTKVGAEKLWYVSTLATDVRALLNEINENYVIPLSEVDKMVLGIWRMRYNLTYDPLAIPVDLLIATQQNIVLNQSTMDQLSMVDHSRVKNLIGCFGNYLEDSNETCDND